MLGIGRKKDEKVFVGEGPDRLVVECVGVIRDSALIRLTRGGVRMLHDVPCGDRLSLGEFGTLIVNHVRPSTHQAELLFDCPRRVRVLREELEGGEPGERRRAATA